MRNIKLKIEYEGTGYAGWQCQRPQVKTIQQVLETALRRIFQRKIKIVASGRTDAGVHAICQVANFKVASNITPRKLQNALNGVLPDDIVITGVEDEGEGFNSRFSVKSKIYRYTILNRDYPSALLRKVSYFYPHRLDIRLMLKESRALLGRHNFSSFQASGSKVRSASRTIKKIRVFKDGSLVHIDIEADGFLYNMVRNIAGTLIEVGRGRFPAGSLKRILRLKDRRLAGPTAPARGLCLMKVRY